jgi:hypothetical protein
MLATRTLVRPVLLAVLVLGGSAVMTATAAAQRRRPIFTLCVKVAAGKKSSYSSEEGCDKDRPVTGTGQWVHQHPGPTGIAWLCVFETGGGFSGGLCTSIGGEKNYKLESSSLTFRFQGKNSGVSTLKGTVGGVSTNIACVTNKFSILPEGTGKSSEGEISYTGCTVNKPAKCIVKEPIVANFNGQLEEPATDKFVDRYTGSSAGEKFVEIEFKNKSTEKCSIENGTKASVTGSQTCEFDSQIEDMEPTQEVICKESGSNLKFGGEPSTYSGNDVVEAPVVESEKSLINVEEGEEHAENSSKQ